MSFTIVFLWWCTGLLSFWLLPFFYWRPNWISRSQVRGICELMLPLFKLLPYPAWGLLRVPLFWAKVEVIRWTHLLLPRSYMRYGLLVATASSLPGRAFCALDAHTKEHVTGPYAMVWLSTEGRCSSPQMSHGGSVSPSDNCRLLGRRWRQSPLHLAFAAWPGMPRKHWSMMSYWFGLPLNRLKCWLYKRRDGVSTTFEWHCTHSACK